MHKNICTVDAFVLWEEMKSMLLLRNVEINRLFKYTVIKIVKGISGLHAFHQISLQKGLDSPNMGGEGDSGMSEDLSAVGAVLAKRGGGHWGH